MTQGVYKKVMGLHSRAMALAAKMKKDASNSSIELPVTETKALAIYSSGEQVKVSLDSTKDTRKYHVMMSVKEFAALAKDKVKGKILKAIGELSGDRNDAIVSGEEVRQYRYIDTNNMEDMTTGAWSYSETFIKEKKE